MRLIVVRPIQCQMIMMPMMQQARANTIRIACKNAVQWRFPYQCDVNSQDRFIVNTYWYYNRPCEVGKYRR